MSTIGWVATLLVTGAALPSAAADVEVKHYDVKKNGFEGPAKNLSGIACVPLNHGEYRCLVIDDEQEFAQFAKIEKRKIEAKAKIQLIEKEPLGKEPSVGCRKGKDEPDGEGVAYSPPYLLRRGFAWLLA
jgi:hypothetical protein